MLPTHLSLKQAAAYGALVVSAVVVANLVWLLTPTWVSVVLLVAVGGYVFYGLRKTDESRNS